MICLCSSWPGSCWVRVSLLEGRSRTEGRCSRSRAGRHQERRLVTIMLVCPNAFWVGVWIRWARIREPELLLVPWWMEDVFHPKGMTTFWTSASVRLLLQLLLTWQLLERRRMAEERWATRAAFGWAVALFLTNLCPAFDHENCNFSQNSCWHEHVRAPRHRFRWGHFIFWQRVCPNFVVRYGASLCTLLPTVQQLL